MAFSIASVESCFPVGSAPKSMGLMVVAGVAVGFAVRRAAAGVGVV